MLTKEAFNALLKTLEEPPSFVYFILATTEIQKVPETIISRCQRFDFKRISEADLVARLKFVAENEEIRADEDALKIIAKQARGGLRDALTMMEQLIHGNKLEAEYVQKVLGLSKAMGWRILLK
jgi:DNA polymerase-3 subunit gamma/tau